MHFNNVGFGAIKNSIVTQLIIVGIVLVVGGGFVRYLLTLDAIQESLLKVVSIHQEALAKEAARDIYNNLDVRKKLLFKLSSLFPLTLLENPSTLSAWLTSKHELNPLFSGALLVLDAKGNVLGGTGEKDGMEAKAYMEDDFIAKAFTQALVIGSPIRGKHPKTFFLPMAVPIKDDTAQVRAILVGLIDYDDPSFFDVIHDGYIGQTGGFLLIDSKKNIFVSSTKKERVLEDAPKPGKNLFHDKVMAGFTGSGLTINIFGVEELAAAEIIPNTDWFVVSRIPTKEAFVMLETIKSKQIQAHLVSIIVIPLLIFFMIVPIFKPLRRSAALADKMSLGEIPLKPLPVGKMDEVGQLTAAFNRLLSMLFKSQEGLKEIAHYDYLTKLPNRLLMIDRLEQALVRCTRNDTHLALLFMDLDGFKAINDSLGHDAGDEALIEVSARFLSVLRESDTLARAGGDEFIIVLSDLSSDASHAENAAHLVANKCKEALKIPLVIKEKTVFLGVSIGIAVGHKGSLIDDLMVEADTKMYENKKK